MNAVKCFKTAFKVRFKCFKYNFWILRKILRIFQKSRTFIFVLSVCYMCFYIVLCKLRMLISALRVLLKCVSSTLSMIFEVYAKFQICNKKFALSYMYVISIYTLCLLFILLSISKR